MNGSLPSTPQPIHSSRISFHSSNHSISSTNLTEITWNKGAPRSLVLSAGTMEERIESQRMGSRPRTSSTSTTTTSPISPGKTRHPSQLPMVPSSEQSSSALPSPTSPSSKIRRLSSNGFRTPTHQVHQSSAELSIKELHHQGSVVKRGGLFGNFCLLVATILYSANYPVLLWLMHNAPGDRSHFTSCNILCASNTIAAFTFWPIFRKDITMANFRALSRREWIAMIGAAVLSNAIGAYLEIEGLNKSSIPVQAMIDMLEPAQFLFISLYILKSERRNWWIVSNGLLLILGVFIGLAILPAIEGQFSVPLFSLGGVYLWLGGLAFVFNEVVAQLYLETIPLGIYGIVRVLFGIVFYHILAIGVAIYQNNMVRLSGLYSLDLWISMAWYGTIFVSIFNYFSLKALKHCHSNVITFGNSTTFIQSIIFGYLILGEYPNKQQYIGVVVIIISLISTVLETYHNDRVEAREKLRLASMESEDMEMDGWELGGIDGSEEGLQVEEEEAQEKMKEQVGGPGVQTIGESAGYIVDHQGGGAAAIAAPANVLELKSVRRNGNGNTSRFLDKQESFGPLSRISLPNAGSSPFSFLGAHDGMRTAPVRPPRLHHEQSYVVRPRVKMKYL